MSFGVFRDGSFLYQNRKKLLRASLGRTFLKVTGKTRQNTEKSYLVCARVSQQPLPKTGQGQEGQNVPKNKPRKDGPLEVENVFPAKQFRCRHCLLYPTGRNDYIIISSNHHFCDIFYEYFCNHKKLQGGLSILQMRDPSP